ncbi:hypothetical protein SO802_034024 [Lithocarpus litseifolius]|uniref:Uncharacterized protein n=1 Tax=Lithocarpus litseifolius TaxID=425828 RepID=A0AAW2BI71_9ROSI
MAGKQHRVGQRDMERRSSPSTAPEAWLPAPMLDGAPLPATASIRDYQGGKGGYMANVVEQALLLPGDMTKLRSLMRHEVFLDLKRHLGMAVQASFRAEEMLNYCHRQMKEEEAKRNDAVDSLKVAERSMQELKRKLLEEERERKSAAATLDSAEKQAKGQRVLLCSVEDQLAAFKAQVVALKKKLEETEAVRVKAERRPAIKLSRRATMSGTYCRQVWIKALNQVGVEASSVLRKAESVYYPPVIRPSLPSLPQLDPIPEKAEAGDGKAAKTSHQPRRGLSLPLLVLVDPIGKGQASKGQEPSEVAATQIDQPPPKERL